MQLMWWCLPQNDITFPFMHESFQIDRLLLNLPCPVQMSSYRNACSDIKTEVSGVFRTIVLVPTITVKSILDSHQLLECQVYSIRKQLGTKRD